MLRLLVGGLKPCSTQVYNSLKNASLQSFPQHGSLYFFLSQIEFSNSWTRGYHRSTFLERGQKDCKGKACQKGQCAEEAAKYQQSSHSTLRPEDVTAAAIKAACKKHLPPPMPLLPKKGLPHPCPPKRTCPPRQFPICGEPPPSKKGAPPPPPPPPHAPQPTRSVLPRQMPGNEDLPPQQEVQRQVTWPTRPVITRIRVCSPDEVRKMVDPSCPEGPPEIYEPLSFKQKMWRAVIFIIKTGIASLLVWLTVDLGFWGSSDESTELWNLITEKDPNAPAPRASSLLYKLMNGYNRAVINFFWIHLNIPEVVRRLWSLVIPREEECFDAQLPDTKDIA